MVKLSLIDKWFIFWGFPYLLNMRSMEVHDLRKLTRSCSVDQMAGKNKRRLSQSGFEKVLTKGHNGKLANGCRWCLKKHDSG
jgi:hypothetical protein